MATSTPRGRRLRTRPPATGCCDPPWARRYPARTRSPRPCERRPASRGGASPRSLPRSTPEPVVRFREEPEVVEPPPPPPEPVSEDEASYSASEASYLSDTTAAAAGPAVAGRRQRQRRPPRMSTTYLFAQPAPKPRAAKQLPIHIRPKLVLQLQQLSADRRPRPSVDVFPSSLIAGNVIAPRFSKRFPRLFGVKGELGLHDTILVKSEDYDTNSLDADSDGDEDSLERRELVAVLSPLRREDRAEIVLDDGSVWVATPLPSGSFDFVHVDEHGNATTARWVRRSIVKAPSAVTVPDSASGAGANPVGAAAPAAAAADSPEHKYTFSVISPQSRRHPIMATLTASTLEILHTYTTVSQSSGRYPPSKPIGRSLPSSPLTSPGAAPGPMNYSTDSDNDDGLASPPKQRTVYPVDDALKKLIMVTAIWLSLRQGAAGSFKPAGSYADSTAHNSPSYAATPTTASPGIPPSLQSRLAARHSRIPKGEESPTPEPGIDRRGTMDSIETATSRLSRRRRVHSLASCPRKDREPSPAPSIAAAKTSAPPRRATSTGAAFMQRRMQAHASDASDSERGPPSRPAGARAGSTGS